MTSGRWPPRPGRPAAAAPLARWPEQLREPPQSEAPGAATENIIIVTLMPGCVSDHRRRVTSPSRTRTVTTVARSSLTEAAKILQARACSSAAAAGGPGSGVTSRRRAHHE